MENKDSHVDEPVSRFWSKISLVADVATIISDNPPIQATFLEAIQRIKEIVPFHSALLSFYNIEKFTYEDEVCVGEQFNPEKYFKATSGERYSAWMARQTKPLTPSYINEENRLSGNCDGSVLAIPLRVENRPIGVIYYLHRDRDFFRERDIKLLSILAHQIAISRERSINLQESEERNQALEKAQKMLRLAQERLVNDERLMAVRELSVSINHEINNPLSVIVGNIQCLLFIEKNLNDKVIERLRRIEGEALRIAEINHRLLEIDELVSETYINNGAKIRMINIEKSITGAKNG